ncbi:isocitrate lyase/PEP mutase family protein [Conexibacter arvalis]|uniref:2-methylisocitrate lyase-like PEP mutase family enzyme n=1 Tax=Conexibacter arvalis TaxID=912552 RepID=A0A840ILF1_9ACTN|nr:isocitrate lyase/phosphoenolpyruvate mutase family protein [Conexibacter arvalis]MBB4665071.1 2-methylisocitrate lyase-like PEP mutase family enzyme [Conexibacter arvalis]
MEREEQRRRARRLHELHQGPGALVVLNAWDAGSARVFERSGCDAVGTTSAGVAFALGRPDGEALARDELVDATARIAAALRVPLTADLESGYGATAEEVGETVAAVLDAGAVGVNLEDGVGIGSAALRPLAEQVDRLLAARAAAEAAGIELFLNARTDVWWVGAGPPEQRIELAIERLRAYVEAGADGVFVPGLADPDAIARLVAAVPAPVNVLAARDTPPLHELERLGVRRVSVGSGPIRAVLDLAGRIALEVLETGTSELMAAGTLTYGEANELFR